MKKRLLPILFLLFAFSHVHAQELVDTASLKIYFRVGHSTLDVTYCHNGVHLDAFAQKVRALQHDTLCHVRKIRIISGTSPEGNTLINYQLSVNRSQQIYLQLKRSISIDDALFDVSSVGINWHGLTALVESSDMPYRSEVLNILYHTPEWITQNGVVVDGRKRQLGMLHSGRAWFYMSEHFFSALRGSDVLVSCQIERIPPPIAELEPIIELQPIPVVESIPIVEPHPTAHHPQLKPFYMSLKTNLLYDALLVPNISVEFYMGSGWSLGGSWMYAWWNNDKRHNYQRIYGGEFNLRKYVGLRASHKPLTGHHLGVYLQGLTYDLQRDGTGSQSKLSYGAGLEYGYSLPIGKRLNLNLTIGVGYLGGEYKTYNSMEIHNVWKQTKQRHWIGPTKAEIAFVWLIGRSNYNIKKTNKR